MMCRICIARVQPSKHVLGHADNELDHTEHTDHIDHTDHKDHTDHTDQESICPER